MRHYHYDMPKVAPKNASEVAIQASCKMRVETQFDALFAAIPNGGKRSFYGQRLIKQVGDLALALRTLRKGVGVIVEGGVYCVIDIVRNVSWTNSTIVADALVLDGVKHQNPCGGAAVFNFRKIKPDTEPCEEEFNVLIKRSRKVDA